MNKLLVLLFFIPSLFSLYTHGQFIISDGISDRDTSAFLEVKSSDRGWLIPRMTSVQRDAITNPAAGLMIYNIDTGSIEFFNSSRWVNVNIAADPNKPCGILSVNFEGILYGTVEYVGRCWLDRNMGASKVADSVNDELSYGDYFQWGRLTDGHEAGNSDTTWALAASPVPGHDKFIIARSGDYDWLADPQSSLWKDSSNYMNNPCPPGWHVPYLADWFDASKDWDNIFDAMDSPLKLPAAGMRYNLTGVISSPGSLGHYWTTETTGKYAFTQTFLQFNSTLAGNQYRSSGKSVRCVRAEEESHQTFARLYGGYTQDIGASIAMDDNGNLIMAGYSQSFGSNALDYFAILVDPEGTVEWAQNYGFYYYDSALRVLPTQDGGYILNGTAGWGSEYNKQMYVIKMDDTGAQEWDISFGNTGDEIGRDIIQNPDGSFLFLGNTTSFGAGGYDVWLTMADVNGDPDVGYTIGTVDNDFGQSMIRDVDGGYVIVGNQCCTAGYGGKDGKITKVRIDNTIHVAWSYLFGGTDEDAANDVVLSHDSSYVIAGYTKSFGEGNMDMWVRKKDSTAGAIWAYTIGGTGTDVAESIVRTPDNGFAVLGFTDSFGQSVTDMMLVKIDADGLVEWAYTYGFIGYEYGKSVMIDNDGYFYALGYLGSSAYMFGEPDFMLLRISPDGSSCICEEVNLSADSSPGENEPVVRKIPGDALVVRRIKDDDLSSSDRTITTAVKNIHGPAPIRTSVTPTVTTICR